MTQPSNLPRPYPISSLNSNGPYLFNTEQGLNIGAAFIDITSSLPPVIGIYDIEVHDFEFYSHDPTPEIRKKYDPRISATLIYMLDQFFTEPKRVLVYLCDSSDGRARERQALFRKWHQNLADTIHRDELEISIGEDMMAYGSILTHKDMPHRDIVDSELKAKVPEILIEKFGG